MLKLKQRALVSTCALIMGTTAFASDALAHRDQLTYAKGDIFGGGQAASAPETRQTFDCYAKPTDLIIAGNPPTFVTIAPFDYTGTPPQDCSTTHITTTETTYYVSAGAGTGVLATFAHDPTLYGHIDQGNSQYFPSVQFGQSTTSLGSTDVGVYNSGGTETQGSKSVNIGSPNQVSCTSGSTNPYPNPLQCYGPLVQFPFGVTPIVFAYNAVYKKVLNNDNSETDYSFNVKNPRGDGSGGLRLSAATYCKIYNGQITNWNDSAITADNGGQSLVDPNDPDNFSVTLQIVGRSDSSGATSIFSRHLANVCAGLSGNQYTTGASTLPASLQGPTYNVSNPNYPPVSGETPGKFTLAPNNSGVAQYVAFTATPGGSNSSNCSDGKACIQLGRITYSGSDYVLPYVAESQQNNYNLNSTTLQNSTGNWEDPTGSTAQAAYSSIQPPQSNKKGNYCSSCLNWGHRNDPSAWVQSTSPTAPIANPSNSGAYPIVGTVNWITYTCFATAAHWKSLDGVMKYVDRQPINTDKQKGILAAAGMAPMSNQWKNAIAGTFVANGSGLGLNIEPVGAAGVCSTAGIVGG
jgi:phosphate transport system substrate-binding protein